MKDIQSREDIILLVDNFYEKIKSSEIGYIFTDVAKLDFDKHMPIMYDFWCTMLLKEQSYKGNPMIKHIQLNQKTQLTDKEFNTWLQLFNQSVDELYAGPTADQAKKNALNIANLMKFKIGQTNGSKF